MPRQAPAKAPRVSCSDRRLGSGEAEESAAISTEVRAKVAPLGQEVAIQKIQPASTSSAQRNPATAAATALALGVKRSFHCSRSCLCAASEAWVRA
ncbi:hypothetical protein D9M72_615650 [compost metagenome]